MPLRRRAVIQGAAAVAVTPAVKAHAQATNTPMRRVRPGDPGWPSEADWEKLDHAVGGRLIKVKPLFAACQNAASSPACQDVLRNIRNPYYIGEQPAGTQTSGWVDAWQSQPSAYAVEARNAEDVVAAVNFARTHRLRLVIKGGGHSYLGGSNAPDSLLVWTRSMDTIALHEAFVGQGCSGKQSPAPAVSVGTGARWLPVYNAVTTTGGLYVQGGGCATVGVAGLVLGNGFGSFSKHYGTAGSSLLEAEIVTADGTVRVANACTNPDLFWALKGGGAGSLGVATRLTLRTHSLPQFFGGVSGIIKANSDAAFQRLIARFTQFYASELFNFHWGESVTFYPDNLLALGLVFYDLNRVQVQAAFRPLLEFINAAPADYTMTQPIAAIVVPARHWWDPAYLAKNLPSTIVHDRRPGAPESNIWWAGDRGQVGFFIHGYESAWLPASLLQESRQSDFNNALFAATRHSHVSLHFNKGLAGGPPEILATARETAMNPAVADAFALAIIAHGGPPAYPGMPGPGPDLARARHDAGAIRDAIGVLRKLVPDAGSYVSEAGFTDPDWQRHSFGQNYPRLLQVKHRYDPDGLFTTHHGVGSEEWSFDGFTRR